MKPVLVLVDLQQDYLASSFLQPPASALIARVAMLLNGARERHIPVLHVWTTVRREEDRRLPHWRAANRWPCLEGTLGHQTPEPLRPAAGETVFHKSGFNAFADPNVESFLRKLGRDTVIIAGLHLHACVRAFAVEALERGFWVRVVEEAVASNDPIHAAATRRWLSERCVRFLSQRDAFDSGHNTGDSVLIHRSPRALDQSLFEVPVAGPDQLARAVDQARDTWKSWRRTSPADRRQMLSNVADRLETAGSELARQMAVEIGKPISQCREELRRSADNVRDVLGRAQELNDSVRRSTRLVRRRPLGVVGLISAWNNPVAIPLGKIAPALAYGNTVVWKPAPAGTHIGRVLLQILRESGLPQGTLQMVTGNHTTAQGLAAQEGIDAVTLTGSLASGHAIHEICGRRMVSLQAELSGNNAAIVWDDADVSLAATQVAWGAFGFAGQRCTANRRVIVSSSCLDDFIPKLEDAVRRLKWGDPLESDTDLGPVIHPAKREEQENLIASAETSGVAHRILRPQEGRAGESWVERGAYVQPVVVCCDRSEHELVQEETMSPLLVVQQADDFESALALCDGVRHGLAASLFSRSEDLQRRFLEEIRAGILKINSSTAGVDVALPFGGWKSSGLGPPEHAEGDAAFYTQMQAVYEDLV